MLHMQIQDKEIRNAFEKPNDYLMFFFKIPSPPVATGYFPLCGFPLFLKASGLRSCFSVLTGYNIFHVHKSFSTNKISLFICFSSFSIRPVILNWSKSLSFFLQGTELMHSKEEIQLAHPAHTECRERNTINTIAPFYTSFIRSGYSILEAGETDQNLYK